jgi:hypothetical protein
MPAPTRVNGWPSLMLCSLTCWNVYRNVLVPLAHAAETDKKIRSVAADGLAEIVRQPATRLGSRGDHDLFFELLGAALVTH